MSTRIRATEKHDQVVRAQIVTDAGVAVVKADVKRIDVRLYSGGPDADANKAIYIKQWTPAAVMFDTMQLTGWTYDQVGFNLKVTIPGARIAPGGAVLKAEITIIRFVGGPIAHVVFLQVDSLTG